MSANVSLDLSSDVSGLVPTQVIDKVLGTLTEITSLNCHELNPVLPDEFEVTSVKAGWRWKKWSPDIGLDRTETWWPEFFWLHIGVADTLDLAWMHKFVSLQEFEQKPLEPPVIELSIQHEWWMTCYDDYGDGGEQKKYLHMPIHNKRGGWGPGSSFPDALVRLAKRRISEAHEFIIPGYLEAQEKMSFHSFKLGELMDKIMVTAEV